MDTAARPGADLRLAERVFEQERGTVAGYKKMPSPDPGECTPGQCVCGSVVDAGVICPKKLK